MTELKDAQQVSWFCVRLVFRTSVAGHEGILQEDSWVLIRASSLSAAEARAVVMGQERVHSYPNESGEIVTWNFAMVAAVQEIDGSAPEDGVEVFSELSRLPNS
jgi:hypothetical protein